MAKGHHADMYTKKPTYLLNNRHRQTYQSHKAQQEQQTDDVDSPALQTNVSHQEQAGAAAIIDTAVSPVSQHIRQGETHQTYKAQADTASSNATQHISHSLDDL